MVQQFCTFFVEDRFFGVDVTRVQEVIRYQEMTRVPLCSGVIGGLINLRGQIVTAIDMRARLGLKARDKEQSPANVVVRCADGPVSLLVDEIGDVIEVDQKLESIPTAMNAATRELISGVHQLEKALLLVLNADRAIAVGAEEAGRNELEVQ